MATENLKLWDQVKATDPKFTKEVSFGRKFTAIDPTWQLLQATKLWGPYGGSWRMDNITFEFVKSLGWDKESKSSVEQVSVVLSAMFVYPGGSFPIVVDDKFKAGDDTLKKLQTGARSKALSYLGFSADVFMGQYEDQSYLKQVKAKFDDSGAFAKSALGAIRTATSVESLASMKDRIQQMVADDIIDPEIAGGLLEEVEDRRRRIAKPT